MHVHGYTHVAMKLLDIFAIVTVTLFTTSLYVKAHEMICICHDDQSYQENCSCVSFKTFLVTSHTISPGTTLRFPLHMYKIPEDINSTHIIVRDTGNITFTGNPSDGLTVIQCDGRISFIFMNITNLIIAGIKFVRCGAPIKPEIIREALTVQTHSFYSIPKGVHASLFFVNVDSLQMLWVVVTESYGYGMLGLNLLGEVRIVHSNFESNNFLSQQTPVNGVSHPCIENHHACIGGNVLILYQDSPFCPDNMMQLQLASSIFHSSHVYEIKWNNSHNSQDHVIQSTIGLGIIIGQKSYIVALHLTNVSFFNNTSTATGIASSGLYIKAYKTPTYYSIFIQDCTFANNSMLYCDDYFQRLCGAAIGYYSNKYSPVNNHSCANFPFKGERSIHISNATFRNNSRGCIFLLENNIPESITVNGSSFTKTKVSPSLSISLSHSELKCNIQVLNSNFAWNENGAISVSIKTSTYNFHATIDSCVFSYNKATVNIHSGKQDGSKVDIKNTLFVKNNKSLVIDNQRYVTFMNVTFKSNFNTAVTCTGSRLHFMGSVFFINNRGTNGGALHLGYAHSTFTNYFESFFDLQLEPIPKDKDNPSYLIFHANTNLYLTGNSVNGRGGAIYVERPANVINVDQYEEKCFYQLAQDIKEPRNSNVTIELLNNSALIAGDSIYGGMSIKCSMHNNGVYKQSLLEKLLLQPKFNSLFHLLNKPSQSEYAMDANILCICDSYDCGPILGSYEVYYGQTLHISVIATTEDNRNKLYGASPALVNAEVNSGSEARLKKGQEAQLLRNRCGYLSFALYTYEKYVNIKLSVHDVVSKFQKEFHLSSVAVSLNDCPLGFKLKQVEYPGCVCIDLLQSSKCNCSIDDVTFSCPAGTWIGNLSNSMIVHHHCPLNYCAPKNVVHLDSLDDQCVLNHSGILCGECQVGLSLVLGSFRCQYCSNVYLLLLFLFALAGLALVLFLLVCDITISKGTVNGLIYFANIVQVNDFIFISPPVPRFLAVFIAWLNLDLGIQTCFYTGMDMYFKAWLQFVFPVYMWLIVAAIVLLSRHSMVISRLTRNNIVSVLATLFLLSYAKLLRAIITVFSFTYLHHVNEKAPMPVWMYDGNVPFLKGKHIALFAVAMFAMFGFIVPYTLLLLLSQYLQRLSHHKPLKWVNRLKPFLDANYGPYKTKIRSWTGIMLLIRATQFIAFAANAEGDQNINLFIIVLFSVIPHFIIWNTGSVYKNKATNILESVFIILTGLLATASLYVQAGSRDKQAIVTTTFLGTVFGVFILIVCYHIYALTSGVVRKLVNHCQRKTSAIPGDISLLQGDGNKETPKAPTVTVSYIAMCELQQ